MARKAVVNEALDSTPTYDDPGYGVSAPPSESL